MANPGGVGSKFLSVNLNKSYGKTTGSSPNASGPGGARFRSANHGTGGMVVLSRPRSSLSGAPKTGPRLSVPPPLNLPSLRKEHERFDFSASGGSGGPGHGRPGSGHSASGMGWMKPGFSEKEGGGAHDDSGAATSIGHVPPVARTNPPASSTGGFLSLEKAVILRGEDFPSLRATLPAIAAGSTQRLELQKPKQLKSSQDLAQEKSEMLPSASDLHMSPQVRSRLITGPSAENFGELSHRLNKLNVSEQSEKQDALFSLPLPLVRLADTSAWADDERDTGHGVMDREKHHGFSRGEREVEIPRAGTSRVLGNDFLGGRGSRDADNGKIMSRTDPYGTDIGTPSREGRDGSSWRSSQFQRDGFSSRDAVSERGGAGSRPFSLSREIGKDYTNKNVDLPYRDNSRDAFGSGSYSLQDSRYKRRDSNYGPLAQNGIQSGEIFNSKGNEPSGRYSEAVSAPQRDNGLLSTQMSKIPFSLGSKGLSDNDPVLNFGREKRLISKPTKPFMEDSLGSVGFDERDPFAVGPLVKKKKNVLKQTDFHDPAREFFEAELERVQKIQEEERQRVAEEQARALELARKEEEERLRLAREEEEHRRRLEEEAKQAAWRAEQERIEALKRAEEQRLAREEEKRKILLEEERRKEAARQKLLELEARMAKRQAASNDQDHEHMALKDVHGVGDTAEWEDRERMAELISSSTSSDSSSLNRVAETGTKLLSLKEGHDTYVDRGKHSSSWKRDMFDNGSSSSLPLLDQDNIYRSPRWDPFIGGKTVPRRELYGGPSNVPLRKGGFSEPHQADDFHQFRGQRWAAPSEADHYSRNPDFESEFPENQMDRFVDSGWGNSRYRNIAHSANTDRLYQNSEIDGFSSFGRSRHSMRQPRVPPPPSLASMQRSAFRANSDRSGSSAFLDSEAIHSHSARRNEPITEMDYKTRYAASLVESGISASSDQVLPKPEEQIAENSPRCDSQSSLSVSSPPNSPPHLSNDELDDTGESPIHRSASLAEQRAFSDNEHDLSASQAGQGNTIVDVHSVSPVDDEEWATENNESMQEQEEYDEEEDYGYQEEDEVQEAEDLNPDLSQNLSELNLDEDDRPENIDQLILGFNDGVEVRAPSSDEFGEASKGLNKELVTRDGPHNEGLVGAVQGFKGGNGCPERWLNQTTTLQESDMTHQGTVFPPRSTSEALDNAEEPGHGSSPCEEAQIMSAVSLPLSSDSTEPVLSPVSSILSQSEVSPVKLQFGLFSGPPLIPSPVPAIQIGTIQMPLHMHPPVGSSLSQMPSQPPVFQFGQLRYTAPISQGILPLGPQAMSIGQPKVSVQYSLNQCNAGSLHNNAGQDPVAPTSADENVSVFSNNQPGGGPSFVDSLHMDLGKESSEVHRTSNKEARVSHCQNQVENSHPHESRIQTPASEVQQQGQNDKIARKGFRSVNGKEGKHDESSKLFSSEKAYGGSKSPATVQASKGKRLIYTVKNNRSSLMSTSEAQQSDFRGVTKRSRRNLQRTEFRVRDSVDKKQSEGVRSTNFPGREEQFATDSGVAGSSGKNDDKKDGLPSKSVKNRVGNNPASDSFGLANVESGNKLGKKMLKKSPSKRQISSIEGKTNITCSSGEDVDPPLQSGVVRVFKQPGIEAPSDEDDFIEVRSKRQMLNDRREQREKELKAKSRLAKESRKPRSVPQIISAPGSVRGMPPYVGGDGTCIHSESDKKDGGSAVNVDVPVVSSSPPLPPIGTPALNTDAHSNLRSLNIKSIHPSASPVISSGVSNFVQNSPYDSRSVAMDKASSSFTAWANQHISQQVMALTQSQLDEAMKPGHFDENVTPIDHTNIMELSKPASSILSQDNKTFSSASSPLNSLLAGEKIQFGAVTSPTILPSSSCTSRSDAQMGHKLGASEPSCSIFFEKEKHSGESCGHVEDPEAEAEAAASAVAVAAISNDEVVGNGLSLSVTDVKSFGGSDVAGLSSGGNHQLSNQSKGEDSLTVTLPPDLSVENPPISLWPPLPSPQNPSNPILSPFPGAPPFTCYEMNPVLGGPIFAFGPHDDSASTQPQSQKSSISGTTPIGAWHTGVDSFYGPPTGFTGPFISPGGIPGIQGPPHMVVYNHFAPVGQFGQVGLSFMGTTYIPSGKQPDWKHTPVSSAVSVTEGEMNGVNIASGPRNSQNMPTPIQHLAPGSPLLPMGSPLAMFDISPFQSSRDMSLQARRPPVAASPLHSVSLSMPLQQQVDGITPSQFNHGLSVDSSTGDRLNDSRTSTPADKCRNFSVTADSASRFPDELGLMDSMSNNAPSILASKSASFSSTNRSVNKPQTGVNTSPKNDGAQASESGTTTNGNGGSNNAIISNQSIGSGLRSHSHTSSSSLHPVGCREHRGSGTSIRSNSGAEWHRRTYSGASKIKQVYVAKPATATGPATTS